MPRLEDKIRSAEVGVFDDSGHPDVIVERNLAALIKAQHGKDMDRPDHKAQTERDLSVKIFVHPPGGPSDSPHA